MSIVERGTIVAGRYVISHVIRPWLRDFPTRGWVCLVLDAIVDRTDIAYIVPHEYASDVTDAARRSALLTDPRIPAVIDVGHENGYDFVITESIPNTPLPDILSRGYLSIEEAQALIGELATAMTHAAKRGLHHLKLSPESLGLSATGEIIVNGIAIDAAILDNSPSRGKLSGAEAVRQDALGIMNIYYAVLTGHWPGNPGWTSLPEAPKRNHFFLPVSEFRDDMTQITDGFVSHAISGIEPGPRSSTEIMRFLEEWDTGVLAKLAKSLPEPTTEATVKSEVAGPFGAADSASPVSGDFAGDNTTAGNEDGSPRESVDIPAPTRSSSTEAVTTNAEPAARSERRFARTGKLRDRKAATTAQIDSALWRLGIARPGTYGLAAGVSQSNPSPFDDKMSMRRASTFPIPSTQWAHASEEWDPDETAQSYAAYAAQEYDAHQTKPIMDREELWSGMDKTQAIPTVPDSSSTSASDSSFSASPDTQMIPRINPDIVGEENLHDGTVDTPREEGSTLPAFDAHSSVDSGESSAEVQTTYDDPREPFNNTDNSWFLGGMFPTREQEIAHQREAFLREQQLREEAKARTQPIFPSPSAPHINMPRTDSTTDSDAVFSTSGSDPASNAFVTPDTSGSVSEYRIQEVEASPEQTSPRHRRRKSRTTSYLVAIGCLLVVGLALSVYMVSTNRLDSLLASENTAPATSATPAQNAEADAKESASGSSDEEKSGKKNNTSVKPLPVASVTALDPQGDQNENSADAKLIKPGVSGTWNTENYTSADFGNLKDGLGLDVKLKKSANVSRVTLISGVSGGSAHIKVGETDDIDDATLVKTIELPAGEKTVEFDKPVKGKHVFLWFKKLPKSGDKYEARISEIKPAGSP